jgi:SAM-dependent methyltransferase
MLAKLYRKRYDYLSNFAKDREAFSDEYNIVHSTINLIMPKPDKMHWYDGWFYARYLDPWVKRVREMVSSFIENDSSVIDIGSGTGALAFQLAGRCKRVVGVDLSSHMIAFANQRRERECFPNVSFLHLDAARLSEHIHRTFDYAVMSLALHEIPVPQGVKIMKELEAVADRIIIADFKTPQPVNLRGICNVGPELLAGIDHFKNCMLFISSGGIHSMLEETGLKVQEEMTDEVEKYEIVKAY